jgi:hypothetical protein
LKEGKFFFKFSLHGHFISILEFVRKFSDFFFKIGKFFFLTWSFSNRSKFYFFLPDSRNFFPSLANFIIFLTTLSRDYLFLANSYFFRNDITLGKTLVTIGGTVLENLGEGFLISDISQVCYDTDIVLWYVQFSQFFSEVFRSFFWRVFSGFSEERVTNF